MSQSRPGVVVVADDDADILDLVALTLERAGHQVHRARDGEEALELIRERSPDVAVLDVAMPRLDGLELTRLLRDDPGTRGVRVVLLTARVQDGGAEAGLAAGANDYVRKPFSPRELQARVAALVGAQPEPGT
ncbi:MAG TPA: response regulator [Gaiellaceae bacterium]|nr:response regulator [Gaiellaceae bacterium]